jgi:hypothetical protein
MQSLSGTLPENTEEEKSLKKTVNGKFFLKFTGLF